MTTQPAAETSVRQGHAFGEMAYAVMGGLGAVVLLDLAFEPVRGVAKTIAAVCFAFATPLNAAGVFLTKYADLADRWDAVPWKLMYLVMLGPNLAVVGLIALAFTMGPLVGWTFMIAAAIAYFAIAGWVWGDSNYPEWWRRRRDAEPLAANPALSQPDDHGSQ